MDDNNINQEPVPTGPQPEPTSPEPSPLPGYSSSPEAPSSSDQPGPGLTPPIALNPESIPSATPTSPEAPNQSESGWTPPAPATTVPTQTLTSDPAQTSPSDPSQPSATTEKPKKSKLGLLITLCILAVLLIGGGVFAAIFLSHRQSDPVVVLDAVTGLMQRTKIIGTQSASRIGAKGAFMIGAKGTISIEFSDDLPTQSQYGGIKSVQITIDSNVDGANARQDNTVKVTTTDGQEISTTLRGAFIADGTFYFQLDNIKEAMQQAIDAQQIPAQYDSIVTQIEDLIEQVDGQWYRIAIADFNPPATMQEAYDCFVDTINKAVSETNMNEFADLYADHPFLLPSRQDEKDSKGNVIYDIKWDAAILADFLNGARDTATYSDIKTCVVEYLGAQAISERDITAEDTKMPEDMPALKLHIDEWSHELRGFSAQYAQHGNSLNVDLSFLYDDQVKVETPTDAKPITDLADSITKMQGIIYDVQRRQWQEEMELDASTCDSFLGTDYYDQCLDAYGI